MTFALRRWKEALIENYTLDSRDEHNFIGSLYKKAELKGDYKKWIYSARFAKIIERLIMKRKIEVFSEIFTFDGYEKGADYIEYRLSSIKHQKYGFNPAKIEDYKLGFLILTSIELANFKAGFYSILKYVMDFSS